MSESISYEKYLEDNETLTYTNVGGSMLPLLREGKDLFTVNKKGQERCKRGDVVLYRRPTKQYILHRIIEVRDNDYVILGDNCIEKEYKIKDEDILGVMTAYVRSEKEHSTKELGYRLYSFIWTNFADFRIFLKKIKRKIARTIKK